MPEFSSHAVRVPLWFKLFIDGSVTFETQVQLRSCTTSFWLFTIFTVLYSITADAKHQFGTESGVLMSSCSDEDVYHIFLSARTSCNTL